MQRLFASGHVVDGVLGVLALEVGLLLVYRFRTRRGLSAAKLLSVVTPGVFLLLALRGALVGADTLVVSACLGAAFVAHIADIAARLRRPQGSPRCIQPERKRQIAMRGATKMY